MMIDPMAAMQAACLQVADGHVAEIELTFEDPAGERLVLLVRRDPWRPATEADAGTE
jgi:hypothetical protein